LYSGTVLPVLAFLLLNPCFHGEEFFMRLRIPSLSLTIMLSTAPTFAATTPLEAVKSTVGGVLSALRDPQLSSNRSQRRERIESALRERFDFDEMAKRSLGPNWARQSASDQKQFVRQFTELLISTYTDVIEQYQGEEIIYGAERRDGNQATVSTKIRDKKGVEHNLDYRLTQQGDDWKVYDVIVADVSLVNNYRSQFSRVLNKSSFADLLQQLSSKKFQSPPGAS
jgi:phospholipid transport system substrate-binding protein